MNINENVSFNAQVVVKDANNIDVQVMFLSANLDTANMNIQMSANTTNKALVEANAVKVKEQYTLFETTVKARALELGFVVF